jgi:predicted dehydrogenase
MELRSDRVFDMTTNVRWGIAGTGRIASLFAVGLARAPGAELVAVASRTPERASAFAERFGVRRSHGGYEALAADPDVDIVYVATPNAEHKAHSLLFLEAGKAVLCEKPFALDAHETRQVVALARRKGLFCMEAMWTRFLPAVTELVERVRAGAIGETCAATIELGHPIAPSPSHALFDPARGGGALLDLGVYSVSLALLLLGPVREVQSQVTFGPTGVDEHVTAMLAHAGGRQSVVTASIRSQLSNRASVSGTDGWAQLHEPLYRPDALTLGKSIRLSLEPQVDAGIKSRARRNPWLDDAYHRLRAAVPPSLRGGGRAISRRFRGNGYCHEAIEAMRCLRAEQVESPTMPLAETLRVMETLDAIRGAWRQV